MATEFEHFRVIIVGAGFAGLTLANALERAGIDYLLLEAARGQTDLNGAGLNAWPQVLAILDQLGCLDEFEAQSTRLLNIKQRDTNGAIIMPGDDWPQLIESRHGYSSRGIERRLLPEILRASLKQQHKFLNHKRVTEIVHETNAVVVHCDDDSSYAGDTVVGADGIRSKVRSEMHRMALATDPAGYVQESVSDKITAQYKCIYGVSEGIPDLDVGVLNVNNGRDRCLQAADHPGGRVFFQLTEKMNKIYHFPDIPRFTDDEAERFAEKHGDIRVNEKLTFGDLWKNISRYKYVALEEGLLDNWTWGRFVLCGDSVHKIVPNSGTGANVAMESAVALANAINKMLVASASKRPSLEEIKTAMQRYRDKRYLRAAPATKGGNISVRVQTGANFFWRLVMRMLVLKHRVNATSDDLANNISEGTVGAEFINYLPTPSRLLTGTMPYNPEQGYGHDESIFKRALLALPMLMMIIPAYRAIKLDELLDYIIEEKELDFLQRTILGIEFLDNVFYRLSNAFLLLFFGRHRLRWHCFSIFSDVGVLYSIFLVESFRRANMFSFISFVVMWAITGEFLSGALVLPIYFFTHYVASPISRFAALDMRSTSLRWTCTVLPAMLLGFYAPFMIVYFGPPVQLRQTAVSMLRHFPAYVSILTYWFSALLPDTIAHDRIHGPLRDVQTIRITVSTLATISSVIWLITSEFVRVAILYHVFSNITWSIDAFDRIFAAGWRRRLDLEKPLIFTSTYLWLFYLFWDLHAAGMLEEGWRICFAWAIGTLVSTGPGASCAMLWLWRETILATRRHKAAVVGPWVPKAKYGDLLAKRQGEKSSVSWYG